MKTLIQNVTKSPEDLIWETALAAKDLMRKTPGLSYAAALRIAQLAK